MYPITLGFGEVQHRLDALHQNGHFAEAFLSSVFVFEKAAKRGLRYFALARGFSSSQADELFGKLGFNDTKDAWPVYERNHTTLAVATGQEWQYVPPAVKKRNKLVHGAQVFDLEDCRDIALKVFDATKSLRGWVKSHHNIDVWSTLPRRLTPSLGWDASLRNK
jgi:hypothetical protein